jgi:hypothetical protein
MLRFVRLSLVLASASLPLGGCLTVSWQDDSTTSANGATVASAQAPPAVVSCNDPNGWDSTGASRNIAGVPKEFNCPTKATQ